MHLGAALLKQHLFVRVTVNSSSVSTLFLETSTIMIT